MSNQYQINREKWVRLINSLRSPMYETTIFNWGQYYHSHIADLMPSLRDDYCYVTVWDKTNPCGKYIVLFSEEEDTECISITNASETIATSFLYFSGMQYEDCLFFESYPYYDRNGSYYFDLIKYQVIEEKLLSKPEWKDRTKEFIELLKP